MDGIRGLVSDVESPLGNLSFEGEVMTMTKDQCQLGQVSKIHPGYCSVIVYAGGWVIGLGLYFSLCSYPLL